MGRNRGLKRWGHKSHIGGLRRFLSSELGRIQVENLSFRLKKLQQKNSATPETRGETSKRR